MFLNTGMTVIQRLIKKSLLSIHIIGDMKPMDKGVFHGIWEQEFKDSETLSQVGSITGGNIQCFYGIT